MSKQFSVPPTHGSLRAWRRGARKLAALAAVLVVLLLTSGTDFAPLRPKALAGSHGLSHAPLPADWHALSPTHQLAADHAGCYAADAGARINVTRSLPLTVNLTTFATDFKDHFGFSHSAEDWASMSGSGLWIERHQMYVTSTRMIRKPINCTNPCTLPLESFVYLQAWSGDFRPASLHYQVGSDYMVGIPKAGRVVKIYDTAASELFRGPEDARLSGDDFGNLILTFNMLAHSGRHYWSYNLTDGNLLHLKPDNAQDLLEKNWAPFFVENHLHFVHSFSPFRVLKCDGRNGNCQFVVGSGDVGVSALRGGTPFVRYGTTDYFVSFARTTQLCACGRAYRPHFVVLYAPRVNGNSTALDYVNMDVVYVSEPLDFGRVPISPPYTSADTPEFCGTFILPCGFLRWELGNGLRRDEAHVVLSVQDSVNVLVKVEGLEQIVANVIATNEERRRTLEQSGILYSPMARTQVKCAERRMAALCPLSS